MWEPMVESDPKAGSSCGAGGPGNAAPSQRSPLRCVPINGVDFAVADLQQAKWGAVRGQTLPSPCCAAYVRQIASERHYLLKLTFSDSDAIITRRVA